MMSATYRHHGKGSADYARKTWMAEQAAPKTYTIFDIEVSKHTYDKYRNQKYDFGDMVLRDFRAIELYTEGKELPEYYPERAEAARKIKAQIIAEITGKEEKAMNTPKKSVEFIAALEELYNNHRAEYGELEKKLNKAKANQEHYEKERAKNPGDRLISAKYDVARGELLIAQDDFRKAILNLQGKHNTAVKELRNQFAAFLDDHYSASPEKLDNSTLALLNSGICSPSELARLAERHQNNPTMLRIVSGHAEKMRNRKNQSDNDYMLCTQVAMMASTAKNGNRELAIFDSAVGAAERGLQTDAGAAGRMHDHIVGWFGDFKSQVENLPYAPEV